MCISTWFVIKVYIKRNKMADVEEKHNAESTSTRRSSSDQRREKLVKWITVSLMVANLVLLIIFAALVLHWRAKRLRALEPVETRICVPRSEFNNSTCPVNTDPNAEKDCCGGASLILKEMLTRDLGETFNEHSPSRIYWSIVGMLSEAKLNCSKTERNINLCNFAGLDPKTLLQGADSPLHWKPVQSDNFNYLEGKVYIKETGHYFVHSQIKLSPPEVAGLTETSDNYRSLTYIHNIQHFSHRAQSTRTMLENAKSHCISTRPGLKLNTTMSTGAVVFLEKRDHVYVTTSHPGHLVPCDLDNRLSLYMIK